MAFSDALTPPTTMHALPRDTSSVLSSAQLLTSPTAVAKELIDNALDAHATSLTLEISANTIDLIQLRDNGHGIPPADRPLTARRHCTSKIRYLADVARLGGATLGFRGEALAGVAECAGTFQIVTRVAGEAVGASMEFGSNGELKEQPGRKSHPVGTTVTAKGFFDRWPVRKQAALKHADRVVAQVKKLMMAYAVTRPAVRFQLKVVKGKGKAGAAAAKGDWVYAPSPGKLSMQDACLKVFGVGCASQCDLVVHEEDGFTVEGLVPKVEADPGKISGIGQFVSVDARPVSTSKGTLKKVAELFKDRLKKSGKSFEGIKDPFLRLEIKCPPEAYDPNVEPAKDDVLFVEPNLVLQVVESFLAKALPEQQRHDLAEQLTQAAGLFEEHAAGGGAPLPNIPGLRRPHIEPSTSPREQITPRKELTLPIRPDEGCRVSNEAAADEGHEVDELRLLSERQASVGAHTAIPSNEDGFSIAESHLDGQNHRIDHSIATASDCIDDRATKRRRTWKSNMYDFDMEDIPQEIIDAWHPSEPEEDVDDSENLNGGVTLSNPWTMAKMNASSTARKVPQPRSSRQLTPLTERSPAQLNVSASTPGSSSPLRQQQLPSPQTSSSPIRNASVRDDFEMEQGTRCLQRPSEEFHENRPVPISPQTPPQPQTQSLGFQPVNNFVPINRPNNGPTLGQRPNLPAAAEQQQSRAQNQRPGGRVNKPFKLPMISKHPKASTAANSRRSGGRRFEPESFAPEWQGRGARHNSADGPDPIFDVPERDPNRDIREFMANRIGQRQGPAPFEPPVIDPDYTVDREPQAARQTRSSERTALLPDSAAPSNREHQDFISPNQSGSRRAGVSQGPSDQDEQLPVQSPSHAQVHTRQLRPRSASTSATAGHDAPLQDRDTASSRPSTRRRTRTRTKSHSAHLPLERIPSTSRTQNLSLTLCTGGVRAISENLRRLDASAYDQLDWMDEAAQGAYDCFGFEEMRTVRPGIVAALATRLRACVQRATADEGCAVADEHVFEEVVAAALGRESKRREGVACGGSFATTTTAGEDEMLVIQ